MLILSRITLFTFFKLNLRRLSKEISSWMLPEFTGLFSLGSMQFSWTALSDSYQNNCMLPHITKYTCLWNNTLRYLICRHAFLRNVITSYMQNYNIKCIILQNRLDVNFHYFDNSSYKWSKSGTAFLQIRVKFISFYPLCHTCT